MRDHTDLLIHLASKYNLQTYLEIGVNTKRNNFDHIPCKFKVGVDPNPKAEANFILPSDEYFELMLESHKADMHPDFDLIFIDGLHEWSQVKRDFDNALQALSPEGFIVLHDCNPVKEIYSFFPRNGLRGVWNGDCYKFILTLIGYAGINFVTVDFDHGCTVVWKEPKATGDKNWSHLTEDPAKYDFKFLKENQHFLKLISPGDFAQLDIHDIDRA